MRKAASVVRIASKRHSNVSHAIQFCANGFRSFTCMPDMGLVKTDMKEPCNLGNVYQLLPAPRISRFTWICSRPTASWRGSFGEPDRFKVLEKYHCQVL